ncbi:elongation factor Ts, mitochondrial [Nerophis lumbriciformis]|uniref:elongation factor Ts, mitochondrial n=1 Tax=Nerophis lumbriciformis TaxID=546530 RepID=UPI002ADFDBC3|nr:elongation factor Ts, mitochondrial-like [Nerophis lumbriciformis]
MSLSFLFKILTKDLAKVGSQHAQAFHTGSHLLAVDKNLLVKLRKRSGYTFINCKKALEKFHNDITQAEAWLNEQAQKEGWSRANKLEGRKAKEGLIGLYVRDKAAVMVEVNCETDFVARNDKFQQLVKDVAISAMAHHQNKSPTGYVKNVMAADQLSKVSGTDGASLADQVALTIGRLGENLSVKRAVTVSVPDEWRIGFYVHGGVAGQSEVAMGRYAALVVFQGGQEESLGRQLGRHIVGEAPASLGNMDDLPGGESETRLLPQTFLGDPDRTVAQVLKGQRARVLDFVRFQCGESIGEEAKL